MTTGEKIKRRRKQLGITQRELAMKTNYTAAAITYIEKGERQIPIERLSDMAKALKCTSAELLPDEN